MSNKRFLNVIPLIPLFLLFLATCSPQRNPDTESPANQSQPTIDFSAYPTPSLVPVTPQGEVATTGFDLQGWT